MVEMGDQISESLDRILQGLNGFNTVICKDIVKVLNSGHSIKPQITNKLLEICIQDPKDDVKLAEDTLHIVFVLLNKYIAGEYPSKPDLLPSLLKIIHMIKTEIYSSKSGTIKGLFFKALLSYPGEVYLELEKDYLEIMELLQLYLHQGIPTEIRVQPINILHKYLKVLPKEKRLNFVKEGINVWFEKLIPNVMTFATIPNFDVETCLETLEIVTDNLLFVDYEHNNSWQVVLQCIYTPQKYPAVLKKVLEGGNDIWHRLWIIFIKLLKSQITKIIPNFGSPINSMLPVVETAFKMDASVRCLAFYCWNTLIDNFATETDEVYINKRIKLLLIPLRSNNAKVENTVLVKLQTWWHLISCFHNKVSRSDELLLVPFLHFCFGKPVCNKPVFVPGLISDTTKEHCVETFIKVLNHHNCDSGKLNVQIITTNCLVDNWKDILHCINEAIKITACNPRKLREPFKCAWISFVKIVCDLSNDDNVRQDLFIGVLTTLCNLVQHGTDGMFTNVILNDLILTLFNGDEKIKQCLIQKDKNVCIVDKIVEMMLNPLFERELKRTNMNDAVAKLKPFADITVEHCFLSASHILLNESPTKYNALVLWSALTASVCEKKYNGGQDLSKMLMWPLNQLDVFAKEEVSTSIWFSLFDFINAKDTNHNILALLKNKNASLINSSFFIKVLTMVLNQKLVSDTDVESELELDLMAHIINKIRLDYCFPEFMKFLDLLPEFFKRALHAINLKLPKNHLLLIQAVFTLIATEFKKSTVNAELLLKVEGFLKSVEKVLQLESLKQIVTSDFIHSAAYMGEHPIFRHSIIAIMQEFLKDIKKDHPAVDVIKNVCESLKQDPHILNTTEQNKFTTPGKVNKRNKKKEANIVNTVVENGEEFVVVKSNWKFNPKKLTDKQKEKFERHREDIPALYQDLSQSQEEFKMSTWKTDSQDTTTTSKSNSSKLLNGGSNEELSSILKNMQSTDVVPKIMKNILTENNDKGSTCLDSKKENTEKIQSPVTKDTKRPKLALKDRIDRNVRNLIENSNVQSGDQGKEGKVVTHDVMKTPTGTSTIIVINSAPSDINLERPSRVRRKPKKFEDLQILPLNKSQSKNVESAEECNGRQSMSKTTQDDTQLDYGVKRKKMENLQSSCFKKVRHSLTINDNQNIDLSNDCYDKNSKTSNKSDEDKKKGNVEKSALLVTPSGVQCKTKQNNSSQKFSLRRRHSIQNMDSSNKRNDNHVMLHKSDQEEINNSDTPPSDNKTDSPIIQIPEDTNKTDVKELNETILNEKHEAETKSDTICKSSDHKNDDILNNQTGISLLSSAAENTSVDAEDIKKPDNQSDTNSEKTNERSSSKKSIKKSRIEKQLAIDMVEGHPFLKVQSEKRITRSESPCILTRKNLTQKFKKNKIDQIVTPKSEKKLKETIKDSGTKKETQDIEILTDSQDSNDSQDASGSQDVIESSQDSTMSAMSVKSMKTLKRIAVIELVNIEHLVDKCNKKNIQQNSSDTGLNDTTHSLSNNNETVSVSIVPNTEVKDDSDFPRNKTASENVSIDLTEDMDTEPVKNDAVIVINDDEEAPVKSKTDDNIHEMDTQDMSCVSLQLSCPKSVKESSVIVNTPDEDTESLNPEIFQEDGVKDTNNVSAIPTQDESTKSLTESVLETGEKSYESSSTLSSKDEEQRKQDFLCNTLEISPIKPLSPVRENKSPSPETSSDYVVIKLTSPVQSNGEPFEKCVSPEVFTEEKVSPDKRDQSPPREEPRIRHASPKCLSIKRNKPQMRAGGRAAQMLDLCVTVSDRLKKILHPEKSTESEEPKKCSLPSSTAAKRKLRLLCISVNGNTAPSEEDGEGENFLKFQRPLPAADSSPTVPILKRKFVDVTDETTVSPASKRKRVSFHDPPVSTTICVKKYIEPCGVRSPQNSLAKRQERQLRSQLSGNLKSQKRLDTSFTLEKELKTAIDSFTESNVTPNSNEDTEMSSLEPTPLVEVVKNCELNDIDPICVELINCKDPIDNIAEDLSSSVMRYLLVKEFTGKIETVGDLAKLTELEVNRLCIKAPKIQVTRKVLTEYLKKIQANETTSTLDLDNSTVDDVEIVDSEIQKDCGVSKTVTIQSEASPTSLVFSKSETDGVYVEDIDLEYNKTAEEETAKILTPLLKEPDSKRLIEQLDESVKECGTNNETPNETPVIETSPEASTSVADIEMQTDCVSFESVRVQTEPLVTSLATTQTDEVHSRHCSAQTDERGDKSSADIVKSLLEKEDYCERLIDQLDEQSKASIADTLPHNTLMNIFVQKVSDNESANVIDRLLDRHMSNSSSKCNTNTRLSFMQEYLSERFRSKDLILLCSELLKKVHNSST